MMSGEKPAGRDGGSSIVGFVGVFSAAKTFVSAGMERETVDKPGSPVKRPEVRNNRRKGEEDGGWDEGFERRR
jgi:hypothetical protein